MATDCIPQVTFEFQGLPQPIIARFDQAHASSDGGALLLKALDEGEDWDSVVLQTDPTFWKLVRSRRGQPTLSLKQLRSRLRMRKLALP